MSCSAIKINIINKIHTIKQKNVDNKISVILTCNRVYNWKSMTWTFWLTWTNACKNT